MSSRRSITAGSCRGSAAGRVKGRLGAIAGGERWTREVVPLESGEERMTGMLEGEAVDLWSTDGDEVMAVDVFVRRRLAAG